MVMRRREFIASLASAAAWPMAGRAQQADRPRILGSMVGSWERDPVVQETDALVMQRLGEMGWQEGRNLRVERRYGEGDLTRMRRFAKEIVGLKPDVIYGSPSPVIAAFLVETQTIPIVFTGVADPVGVGFVDSLAKPGRNVTGFTLYDHAIATKWLELL